MGVINGLGLFTNLDVLSKVICVLGNGVWYYTLMLIGCNEGAEKDVTMCRILKVVLRRYGIRIGSVLEIVSRIVHILSNTVYLV